MDIDSMIAVLQAAKAGRAEWKYKKSELWSPFEEDTFNRLGIDTNQFDYRKKPEPREWTLHKPDNPTSVSLGHLNAVPYDPYRGTECLARDCRPIHVREVLE